MARGIKFLGDGEWQARKHGVQGRRQWRKVHLAMDTATSDIRAVEFAPSSDGDSPVLPELLDQIPGAKKIGTVTASSRTYTTLRGSISTGRVPAKTRSAMIRVRQDWSAHRSPTATRFSPARSCRKPPAFIRSPRNLSDPPARDPGPPQPGSPVEPRDADQVRPHPGRNAAPVGQSRRRRRRRRHGGHATRQIVP